MITANENRKRYLPLFGLGLQYKTTAYTNAYANISQAYRPISYSELTPIGVTSKIDPNLEDAKGFNADLGYRGTVKNYLNFDIGLFYIAYDNRIGTILMDAGSSNPYTLRTNVANSVHKGLESYVEFNLLKYLNSHSKKGLNIFNSLALINAATYSTHIDFVVLFGIHAIVAIHKNAKLTDAKISRACQWTLRTHRM